MAEEMLDGRIKAGSLVEVGFDAEKAYLYREGQSRPEGQRRRSNQRTNQPPTSLVVGEAF